MRLIADEGNTVSVQSDDTTAVRGWSVQFYCQWIEWLRRRSYKWYEFTLIEITVDDSWKCTGYVEIRVGLLGCVLMLTRWRPSRRISSNPEEG